MRRNIHQALMWSFAALAVGLVSPSAVIWCLQVFVGGIRPLDAAADVLRGRFPANLFQAGLLGLTLLPFALLSVASFVAARRMQGLRLACVAGGGLTGILALMIPAHASVSYPLYGPGHPSSTAALAFLFIPFYCVVSLGIGLLAGWIASLAFKDRSAGR